MEKKIITMKKKIIFAIIIISLILLIDISTIFPRKEVLEPEIFNQKMITFYDQYFFLQEERVRLAKSGYESASDEEILDQMSVARNRAKEALNTLQEMENIARELETQETVGLIPYAWAREKLPYRKKYGLAGAILSKVPLIGRLVDGFDAVHESARMGIYKAYQSTLPDDRPILEEELKKCGLEKIEDIFTCNFVKVDKILSEASSFEWGVGDGILREADIAKAAAKLGRAATLAYVDGILAATGVTDLSPDYLPGDLEDYLKIMLGKQTVKEYLKSKSLSTGLEVWRKAVDPEVEQGEEEVIIATNAKVEKTITGVLTGQIPSDILKPEDEKTGVIDGEIQPYDKWTKKEKRAVAQKLNTLEQEEPLMVIVKVKPQEKTKIIVPEGEWEVLDVVEKTVPVVSKNVKIREDQITSIVNIIIRINELMDNPEETFRILEQCKIYQPGEKYVPEEPEEIVEPERETIGLRGTVSVNPSTYTIPDIDSQVHRIKGSGIVSMSIVGTRVSGNCDISARDYWKCQVTKGGHCVDVHVKRYEGGSWVPGAAGYMSTEYNNIEISGNITGTYDPSTGEISAKVDGVFDYQWSSHKEYRGLSLTGIVSGNEASGIIHYTLPNGQPGFNWSAKVVE